MLDPNFDHQEIFDLTTSSNAVDLQNNLTPSAFQQLDPFPSLPEPTEDFILPNDNLLNSSILPSLDTPTNLSDSDSLNNLIVISDPGNLTDNSAVSEVDKLLGVPSTEHSNPIDFLTRQEEVDELLGVPSSEHSNPIDFLTRQEEDLKDLGVLSGIHIVETSLIAEVINNTFSYRFQLDTPRHFYMETEHPAENTYVTATLFQDLDNNGILGSEEKIGFTTDILDAYTLNAGTYYIKIQAKKFLDIPIMGLIEPTTWNTLLSVGEPTVPPLGGDSISIVHDQDYLKRYPLKRYPLAKSDYDLLKPIVPIVEKVSVYSHDVSYNNRDFPSFNNNYTYPLDSPTFNIDDVDWDIPDEPEYTSYYDPFDSIYQPSKKTPKSKFSSKDISAILPPPPNNNSIQLYDDIEIL
ncbi:MAG: hypothetical protein VKK42_26620 [Lyngbya sp.]|nr:hypothetical protein [Lyngbya sp.]